MSICSNEGLKDWEDWNREFVMMDFASMLDRPFYFERKYFG